MQRKQNLLNDTDLSDDDENKFERPISPSEDEEKTVNINFNCYKLNQTKLTSIFQKEERELNDRKLKDRIRQLERNNLSLRRMLEIGQSNSDSPNRYNVLPRFTSARISRSLLEAPLGPPT